MRGVVGRLRKPGNHIMPGVNTLLMYRETLEIDTYGEGEIVDITDSIRGIVERSGIAVGLVHVFAVGSTAAITTIEYEKGVLADLRRSLCLIAPDNIQYEHDRAWCDGNGRSHVKAAIIGPDLIVPVSAGDIACGTWQQIVLLELDVRPSRRRSVIVTVSGE
jgi:secondary thiamine-phosphate synthase enzyme